LPSAQSLTLGFRSAGAKEKTQELTIAIWLPFSRVCPRSVSVIPVGVTVLDVSSSPGRHDRVPITGPAIGLQDSADVDVEEEGCVLELC
jgi:hypothetical protein